MIFITSFATSMFVAMGVERLAARRVSPKYPLAWLVSGLAFGLLMTVGGYSAFMNAVTSSMSAYGPQVVDRLSAMGDANKASAILGVWRSFLFVLLGAGLIWAYLTDRVSLKNAVVSLTVLLVADLWSIERLYWSFSPPASVVFATDPAAAAINADIAKTGQPGRVLQLRLGQGLTTELGYLDRAFTGDKLWVAGLRVVEGYHGNELGAYQRMLSLTIDSVPVTDSPTFWRHENVQYVYTAADEATMTQVAAQLKAPPFVKLAGPVRNTAGSMVYAYRVGVDNPPAWVATMVVKAPGDAPSPPFSTPASIRAPSPSPTRASAISPASRFSQYRPRQPCARP